MSVFLSLSLVAPENFVGEGQALTRDICKPSENQVCCLNITFINIVWTSWPLFSIIPYFQGTAPLAPMCWRSWSHCIFYLITIYNPNFDKTEFKPSFKVIRTQCDIALMTFRLLVINTITLWTVPSFGTVWINSNKYQGGIFAAEYVVKIDYEGLFWYRMTLNV